MPQSVNLANFSSELIAAAVGAGMSEQGVESLVNSYSRDPVEQAAILEAVLERYFKLLLCIVGD